MQELKPLPDPEVNNWETAPIEDLRKEVHGLRLWCGSLFLQVKEWTTRSNDLQQTGEQVIKLQADHNKQLSELDENISLIMESLGLSNGTAPDDTPQPHNNLTGNPYN